MELLLTAKRYYEEFVKERGDDPELRAEQAQAYGRLAQITAEIGSKSEAVKLYQKAGAILEPLGGDPSASPAYADALARMHNNLGLLYQAIGATGEAETAYRQVLRLRKALVRRHHAQVAAHRAGLADGYTNLGNLYFALGRTGEAEPAYNQAHGLLIALAKEHGKVTEYRAQLATSYHNLGGLYQATGRLKAAEEAYQEGLKVCRLLCKLSQNPGPQSQLALSQSNLGTVYSATGRPKLAEETHKAALKTWRQLAAKHPLVANYHFGVARSTLNLGRVYSRTERLKEAEGNYGEALLTLERLDKEHPLVHRYKDLLSEVHNHLGGLNRARGRPWEAEAAYRRALDIRTKLAGKHPELFRFVRGAGEVAYNLGLVFLRDRDDAGGALKCFTPAVDYLQKAFSQGGPHSGARATLCKALGHRAIALTRLGRLPEALRDWDRALKLDNGKLHFPMLLSRAETLSKARQEAVEFARSGEHARAAALAQALAAQRSLTAKFCYQVAAVYALAFAAARKDVARPEAERARLAEEHATRALDLLKRANAAGYFKAPANLAKLKHDPDFDTLRPRDDFKRLLSAVEGKAGDAPPGRGPKQEGGTASCRDPGGRAGPPCPARRRLSQRFDPQVAELDPALPALQTDVPSGVQEVRVLPPDLVRVLLQLHVLHGLAVQRHSDPRPPGDDPQRVPLPKWLVDVLLQRGGDAKDRARASQRILAISMVLVVHQLDFVRDSRGLRLDAPEPLGRLQRAAQGDPAVAALGHLVLQAKFQVAELPGVHQPSAPLSLRDDNPVAGERPAVARAVVDPELRQVEQRHEARLVLLRGLVLCRRMPARQHQAQHGCQGDGSLRVLHVLTSTF
jgi:tetratricopeptide (TPR) repeat protein